MGNDKGLPLGWSEVGFKESCTNISLTGIKVKEKEYKKCGKFPTVDQGKKLIGGYFDDENMVINEEPPYIVFGDHTKVKKFITFKFIPGGDGLKVLKANKIFYPKLLYYFIQALKLPDKGYARHYQYLEKEIVPLPPINEQHRIVEKIEELFSELDAGIKALKTAQEQLKVYRQAVLKDAFEGKLIKKDDGLEWKWTTLGTFAENIRIGPFGTLLHESDYVANGTPVINPKHIKNQKILHDCMVTVSTEKLKELSSYILKENDIILGRRGEMGRTAYITEREDGWVCGTGSMIIRLKNGNLAKVYSLLLSEKRVINYLKNNCTGTTMSNLNEKIVKSIPIPIIPFDEQKIIFDEIETRFSLCDNFEETVEQSLAKAEVLRQSILQRAFAGQLVVQDPNDEPVYKLLERIRLARENNKVEKEPAKGRTKK